MRVVLLAALGGLLLAGCDARMATDATTIAIDRGGEVTRRMGAAGDGRAALRETTACYIYDDGAAYLVRDLPDGAPPPLLRGARYQRSTTCLGFSDGSWRY